MSECHCLKHSAIPHSTRLFTDFLYQFDQVKDFFPHNAFDPNAYKAAAAAVSYPAATRAAVGDVLEEQARSFGAEAQVLANIERFRKGAYAIVTGQQVGLFGGPIFSFYKALTAIKHANTLTSQGLDTVPIFWLATEDHDLAEVNHTFLLDSRYEVESLRAPSQPVVPNAPVGDVVFHSEIVSLGEKAIGMLTPPDGGDEVARENLQYAGEALRNSYRDGATFGDAFARWMSRLFGRFGVLVMDPTHPRLRSLAAPVFRKSLESAGDIFQALQSRNQELTRRGYHQQVHVTETTSLLFVLVDGQRVPLRRRDGEFLLNDKHVTPAKLLGELEKAPGHFSPNVLLRPVMQDSLLPTVGYVGGPAELAYFAQAGAVYERVLGRMPVVIPRASFTLVDAKGAKLLSKYGLRLPDLFQEPQLLKERMALRFLPAGLSDSLDRSEKQLAQMIADLGAQLGALDFTLSDSNARAGRKMTYQLRRLKEKAARVTARRTEQVERDANLLVNLLHPRKALQERVFSGLAFLARYGPSLLDLVYEKVSTQSADHQVVSL